MDLFWRRSFGIVERRLSAGDFDDTAEDVQHKGLKSKLLSICQSVRSSYPCILDSHRTADIKAQSSHLSMEEKYA